MGRFAFIIHPLNTKDMVRKYPVARYLPDWVIEAVGLRMKPLLVSHVTGIRSPHAETEGWFLGLTLTSRQMVSLPTDLVIDKIIRVARVGERLGVDVIGLGAFTSVVGDAGVTIAKNLRVAVTTGNSYTVATALEGARQAAEFMGIDWGQAEVAVVGATGSIGRACSHILARQARKMTLIGKDLGRLDHLARQLLSSTGLTPRLSTDINRELPKADIILAVSSAVDSIIQPEHLKPGAVVCDVARPRDVSVRVATARDDVLVIEGGVVEVPGQVDFGFNFGFPPGHAMACMAETMLLALEGRHENFTLGKDLTVRQIEEISALARKHGFRLAGLRSFDRALDETELRRIRDRAARRRMIRGHESA